MDENSRQARLQGDFPDARRNGSPNEKAAAEKSAAARI
jgi:hypothetical protein